MKLYELTNDFAQLFEQFDEISKLDGDAEEFKQAWFDEALQAGQKIEGASLIRTQTISIK